MPPLSILTLTLSGPYLHSVEISKLEKCSQAIKVDDTTFGIHCVKNLLVVHRFHVTYETKTTAKASDGVLAVKNATLVTMATGNVHKDVIRQGVLVVEAGIVKQIGKESQVNIPNDATIIDAEGGKHVGSKRT